MARPDSKQVNILFYFLPIYLLLICMILEDPSFHTLIANSDVS